jgi:Fuc2NAc and GlcNAc transferase
LLPLANASRGLPPPMIVSGFIVAVLAVIGAALVSLAVTALVLRHAHRFDLVQAPDERSAHTRPIPTGGGLGIVVGGTLAALPTAAALPWPTLAVLAAGLMLAAVGLADDRRPLGVAPRLIAQLAAASVVVAGLPLDVLGPALVPGLPVLPLAGLLVLGVTLWVNLYNFMDGIDGLAASQALYMLLGATLISIPGAEEQVFFWWMVGLAAATAGFLVLNWPPARIFMGDVGSTYIGLMIGFLALATVSGGWLTIWQWLILSATFLADGVGTLVRRLLRGEPIWQAHRLHAYQALQRRFGSHQRATLIYLGIDVALLPVAWLAGTLGPLGYLPALIVYLLLVPAALLAGAGRPLTTRG